MRSGEAQYWPKCLPCSLPRVVISGAGRGVILSCDTRAGSIQKRGVAEAVSMTGLVARAQSRMLGWRDDLHGAKADD